jgi:hypothetical protein
MTTSDAGQGKTLAFPIVTVNCKNKNNKKNKKNKK